MEVESIAANPDVVSFMQEHIISNTPKQPIELGKKVVGERPPHKMTTTLPLFWHLSSASKKERIDASVKLIGALEQFQAQFIPKDTSGPNSESEEEDEDEDEEGAPKSDGLDALNAQDVSYSIRRLVRGLASPRESSRLGFAVALTEVSVRVLL